MANSTGKKPLPNGKKANGQFAKGNKAGCAHKSPAAKRKETLAEAFKAAVTITDIKAIAKKMAKQAKGGDVKAAQFVLDRCCGKPPQAIALTGAESGPIAVQVVNYAGAVA